MTVASHVALFFAARALTRWPTRSLAACRASTAGSVVGDADGVGVNGTAEVPGSVAACELPMSEHPEARDSATSEPAVATRAR